MAKNAEPKRGDRRPSKVAIKDALRPYRIGLLTLRKMVREVMSPHLPKPFNMIEAGFHLSSYILLYFLGPDGTDHYLWRKGLMLKSTYFGDERTFFLRV